MTRGERREAAVAAVGYDRLEPGQRRVLRVELRLEELSGRLDVVRLGRLDRDRERQAEDLDQDRALGPARVSAATAGLVEGRAGVDLGRVALRDPRDLAELLDGYSQYDPPLPLAAIMEESET